MNIKNKYFFEFYNERLKFIKENSFDRIEGVILICSYIDALSGYRYGGASCKSRFTKFVLEYTNQSDIWNKISLILLRQHFEYKNDDFYNQIIIFLNKLGAISSSFIDLNYNPDISIDNYYNLAEKSLEVKYLHILKSDIEEYKYCNILWNYFRNYSVHNTSIGFDRAMNIANKVVPFYSNQNKIENKKIVETKTCFDIPFDFLVLTLENCLTNFNSYLDDKDIILEESQKVTNKNKNKNKVTTSDNDKIPNLITKPFITFLNDAGRLIDQAKINRELFKTTDKGEYRWLEGAYARSSIISTIFFLESIIESIYKDFRIRESWQFPYRIQKKHGLTNKSYETLPLIERIYLIPYLCIKDDNVFTKEFFNKESKSFQELREIIKIRDQFAHSKSFKRKMEIKVSESNDKKYINDNFSDNNWPITKIPKDVFIIDYNHAKIIKDKVDKLIEKLDDVLEGKLYKKNWMTSEILDLHSR